MKQTVLISGGSDGLGLAIAKVLVSSYQVVLLARSEEKLKILSQELNCDYVVCDVTRPESVQLAVDRVKEKCKKIDCVINNAGIWIEGNLEDNSYENIHKAVEVNTLGTIYLCKAVLPLMKAQKGGRIINIISQAGLKARAFYPVYSASKWAITGFTKSLQEQLANENVAVTGIYPGKLDTKLFKKTGSKMNIEDALNPEEVAHAVKLVLEFPVTTLISELGIRNIEQF